MTTIREEIRNNYPEILSLENIRCILRISKRKASWMLQNGIIKCENNGKKTLLLEAHIDEIGFIVAVTDVLGDDELTFDFKKYVTGVAYNKENGTDIVFDRSDDTVDVFTCVVRNIPVKKYKTNLTCKTYTKITVGGEQFTLYGEPVVGNVYDTARTLLTDDTLDTETKNALYQIILDYECAIGLPGDDLYE